MVAKEITSLQHPLVKEALRLRTEKDVRDVQERVLIAGQKLIRDLSAHCSIQILFYTGDAPSISALEMFRVSEAVLKKITGLDDSSGWAAIVLKPGEQPLEKKDYILILDQVSDPGNLGTLWRSALGFGWQGIWLTPGCVDPFNDKALRAAQGATFLLPYERVLPEKILSWARARNASLFVGDLHGSLFDQCKFRPPLALILGNEGRGPGEWAKSIAKVTIPIQNIDSLNVASAGAILLYAMRPHQ